MAGQGRKELGVDTMYEDLKREVASGKLPKKEHTLKGGAYREGNDPWEGVYHRTGVAPSV
jgi:hypothetical protein